MMMMIMILILIFILMTMMSTSTSMLVSEGDDGDVDVDDYVDDENDYGDDDDDDENYEVDDNLDNYDDDDDVHDGVAVPEGCPCLHVEMPPTNKLYRGGEEEEESVLQGEAGYQAAVLAVGVGGPGGTGYSIESIVKYSTV